MATAINGFPGFGLEYDSSANPFFGAIMAENLRLIQSKELGKKLLKLIADAIPASRGDFPRGINVVCRPYMMTYIQSGKKLGWSPGNFGAKDILVPSTHAAHNIEGCPFHKSGSSRNMAVDQKNTASNGTVCWMDFSNAQVLESSGAITWPHIVLAHELIHSYHCLYGIHAGSDEEIKTTGIGDYAGEEMSENGFRAAFGFPIRAAYG